MDSFSAQTTYEAPVLAMAFVARIDGRTPASCEVTVEMYEHSNENDPTPTSTLNGAAQLNAAAMEIENDEGQMVDVGIGEAVLQAILPGRVTGATYLYRFIMTFADGTNAEEDATQTITRYAAP
jgi:hypothetical protein